MKIVEDKGGAIALMIVALVFLGTWPALLNLLERRGRNPVHTYLDYSITNFLMAVIIALTLGQIGAPKPGEPNFTTQLSQNNGPSVGFAVAGGVFLCCGNLATQYALAFVGLSVTEVVASSITVVAGTTMNYFLDDRINNAAVLFPGVGCFLIAACLGSWLHASNVADIDKKLGIQRGGDVIDRSWARDAEAGGPSMMLSVGFEQPSLDAAAEMKMRALEEGKTGVAPLPTKAEIGSAAHLQEIENKRCVKVNASSKFIGLAIVFTAGACYSIFSPAFNLSTNDQWHKLAPGVDKLVIYTAFFYFSLAFFACAVIINVCFLYKPAFGVPKSSIGGYLKDWNGRWIALLAGILCGWGNGFQFMGGQAAGYAAADAVQALPLVSTFWGIVIFGEYRRATTKTYILLAAMLCMFAAAVGLLMGSSGTRKN
ncbi:hypothetical protein WJX79_006556 [Trebouxia sp. C0005]|nr:MAG: ureide permease 2 [Trebouxia sp. A1-2]